jgi:hypothetical protein
MVFSRSNGTTVARTGIAVGVARDVGYRFAGDCNPISFKGYFGVVVSDDLAVPGQHVDDLRFIAVRWVAVMGKAMIV